mgnify:CR=1 FL=1
MRTVLFLLAFFAAGLTTAAELQLTWSAPTEDCEGQPIEAGQLATMEIYMDTKPIPGPATTEEACAGAGDPPPAGFNPVIADPAATLVRIGPLSMDEARQLFVAGVVPGVLGGFLLMLVTYIPSLSLWLPGVLMK